MLLELPGLDENGATDLLCVSREHLVRLHVRSDGHLLRDPIPTLGHESQRLIVLRSMPGRRRVSHALRGHQIRPRLADCLSRSHDEHDRHDDISL